MSHHTDTGWVQDTERCLRLIEARIRRLEESLLKLRAVRDWIASPGMTEHDTADRNPSGIPAKEH